MNKNFFFLQDSDAKKLVLMNSANIALIGESGSPGISTVTFMNGLKINVVGSLEEIDKTISGETDGYDPYAR